MSSTDDDYETEAHSVLWIHEEGEESDEEQDSGQRFSYSAHFDPHEHGEHEVVSSDDEEDELPEIQSSSSSEVGTPDAILQDAEDLSFFDHTLGSQDISHPTAQGNGSSQHTASSSHMGINLNPEATIFVPSNGSSHTRPTDGEDLARAQDLLDADMGMPDRKRRRADGPSRGSAEDRSLRVRLARSLEKREHKIASLERVIRRFNETKSAFQGSRGLAERLQKVHCPETGANALRYIGDPSLAHKDLALSRFLPPQHIRPPRLPIGNSLLLFISEIFPRRFGITERGQLINIFREEAPYIPLCVSAVWNLSHPITYHHSRSISRPPFTVGRPCGNYRPAVELNITKRRAVKMPVVTESDPVTPSLRWPDGEVPLEVFDVVGSFLDHDSLQSMRLVNREFEKKISSTAFRQVVVPFREEIYGMMVFKTENIKGKGKANATHEDPEDLEDPDKPIHDGMKVFESWGPHIRNFAMAFEIDEATLVRPPLKDKYEIHTAFFGTYKWPHRYYNRYEQCEELEKKADDFKCMSHALSNLNVTRELGLSIDSGLGWLCGPDVSDRARLFKEKAKIFGKTHQLPGKKIEEANEIWRGIVGSIVPTKRVLIVDNGKAFMKEVHGLYEEWLDAEGRRQVRNTSDPSIPPGHNPAYNRPIHRPLVFDGVDHGTKEWHTPEGWAKYSVSKRLPFIELEDPSTDRALNPRRLTVPQKEWLLETEWAQRAFIVSFCMALSDNGHTFQSVHSLKIGKLSSRYLSMLQRADVWSALPSLVDLTINVSPDWRDITKSETGAETIDIYPSLAATQFNTLLQDYIAGLSQVKVLRLGYIGGGEHQEGIFGRNQHVLPAPLMSFDDPRIVLNRSAQVLEFPHVEEFTLSNCWMTPHMIKTFVKQMKKWKMTRLNLDSISLTANTTPPFATERPTPTPSQLGPARYTDPALQPFFQSQGFGPPPLPKGWITTGIPAGSWGSVINAITPGVTMSMTRYAYNYTSLPPPPPTRHTLDLITFTSCGYLYLPHFPDFPTFPHLDPADWEHCARPGMYYRRNKLYAKMMRTDDPLTGRIFNGMTGEERDDVFRTAFFPAMRVGWRELGGGGEWNAEDMQVVGGKNRFSGRVERFGGGFPWRD